MSGLFHFLDLGCDASSKKNRKSLPKRRMLTLESLEERQLLSVSSGEYEIIKEKYPGLNIPDDQSDISILEISDLTVEQLCVAIDQAGATPEDDLLVLRTDSDNYCLDLKGQTIRIDIDSEQYGSLSIVSIGEKTVEIGINEIPNSTIFVDKGDVHLANFCFTGFDPNNSLDDQRIFLLNDCRETFTVESVSLADSRGNIFNSDFTFYESNLDVESIDIAPPEYFSKAVSGTNYAVIFSGGGNASGNSSVFYDEVVRLYDILIDDYNLSARNIFIIYADGTSPGLDQNVGYYTDHCINSDMSFAQSDRVFSATANNFDTVMTALGSVMTANDHLLVFTADHGRGDSNNALIVGDEELCAWGNSHISGSTFANSMFKITKGYVTVVLTQCFSGGILDNIINPSTGACKNSSISSKWYGMAASNHYESSHYSIKSDGIYIRRNSEESFATTFLDAIDKSTGNKQNTKLSFEYAKSHDPWVKNSSYANNLGAYDSTAEHPWGAGASFDIFSVDAPITDDACEPNDSRTDAYNLGSVQGLKTLNSLKLAADNSDWFKFTLTQEGSVDSYVKVIYTHKSKEDVDLYIYDSLGQEIDHSNLITGIEEISLCGYAAGTYYIRVFNYYDAVAVNSYSLSVNAPVSNLPDLSPFTPSSWSAPLVFSTSENSTISSDIIDNTHNVYVNFSVANVGDVKINKTFYTKITITGGDLSTPLTKSYYTSSLNAGFYADITSNSWSLGKLSPGTYTATLETDSTGVISESNENNNSYSIAFTVVPADDPYESNDSRQTAYDLGTLTQSKMVSNLVLSKNNEDWFKFTTTSVGSSTSCVKCSYTHITGRADVDIYLYDANGNNISSSIYATGTESISLEGLAAGTYYVRAKNYISNSYVSSYSISIIPPVASTTISVSLPANSTSQLIDLTQNGLSNRTQYKFDCSTRPSWVSSLILYAGTNIMGLGDNTTTISWLNGSANLSVSASSNTSNVSRSWTMPILVNDSVVANVVITQAASQAIDLKTYNQGFLSSSSIIKGDVVKLSGVQIQNIGTGSSGNYSVNVYASSSSSNIVNGILLKTISMPSLSAGSSTTLEQQTLSSSGLSAGSWYIGWVISSTQDSNFNNNIGYCSTTIMVANPQANGYEIEVKLVTRKKPSYYDVSQSLPTSLTSFDMNSTVYAEIWVKNTNASDPGIMGGYVTLNYSDSMMSVGTVNYGSVFCELTGYQILSNAGSMESIGGYVDQNACATNEWVRLACVSFTARNTGAVALSLAAPTDNRDNFLRSDTILLGASQINFGSASIEISNSNCPMDIDGDGYIGGSDYTLLKNHWRTYSDSSNWDARCDIDGDGYVGGRDYVYLKNNWRKYVTDPSLIFPSLGSAAAEIVMPEYIEPIVDDKEIVTIISKDAIQPLVIFNQLAGPQEQIIYEEPASVYLQRGSNGIVSGFTKTEDIIAGVANADYWNTYAPERNNMVVVQNISIPSPASPVLDFSDALFSSNTKAKKRSLNASSTLVSKSITLNAIQNVISQEINWKSLLWE